MKESFEEHCKKNPRVKIYHCKELLKMFLFSLFSENLTIYYEIHRYMLVNYFYFCFNFIFSFNITTFTALFNISKGLAGYQGNCQYSLANLTVNHEHANNLDNAKKRSKKMLWKSEPLTKQRKSIVSTARYFRHHRKKNLNSSE